MTTPGKNAINLRGFPTPDTAPDSQAYLVFYFPDSPEWPQLLLGAAQELANEYNWYQWGALLPEQASEAFRLIIQQAPYNILPADVPTPFWDENSGDDSDDTAPRDTQPWYGQIVIIDDRLTFIENVGIYLIAGFIAYAGVPSAAIAFIPFARNFVVQFRGNPLGGLIKFFADGQQIGQVDTYAPSDTVISAPVSMPAPAMGFAAADVTYPTFWVELGDEVLHDQPSVSMTLIRSRLSEADFAPTNQRYNSDCDCVQYSPDNGTTWVDAPEFDPRHSSPFRLPVRTGTDIRCKCAASMVKWLKDFLDYETTILCAGATLTAIVNVVLNAVDLLFPGAVLLQLLLDVADLIFGVGCTALTAAFTSTEYDTLECIFYCNIGADGSVSAVQLAQIETQVTAELNTTAALIVNAILGAQGEVGLSNAGTLYDLTADCSSCVCPWCYVFDFTVSEAGFAVFSGQCANWVSGSGWEAEYCAVVYSDYIYITMPDSFEITFWELTYSSANNDGTNIFRVYSGDIVGAPVYVYSDVDGENETFTNRVIGGDIDTTTGKSILISWSKTSGSCTYGRLKLKGIGVNPFGDDNC